MIRDFGKLTREVKDIIENLVDNVNADTIRSCRAYLFQITWYDGIVSTISLASNGLYVVLHQCDISLPCSSQGFDDFVSSLSIHNIL